MISIIVKLPARADKVDELVEVLKGLVSNTSLEEGTLGYSINRSKAEPNTIVILERYKDKTALDAHTSSLSVREFFERMPGLLQGKPEISFMEELASI